MWFKNPDGSESHMPVNCGLTNAETGLRFYPDCWEFTKFGVTVTVHYAQRTEAKK